MKDCGIKSKSITVESKEISSEADRSGGANSTGEETVQKASVNQSAINDEIAINALQPLYPDSLHGEWIKLERKKKNNKANARGYGGSLNGQHSKNVVLNMIEKLNR